MNDWELHDLVRKVGWAIEHHLKAINKNVERIANDCDTLLLVQGGLDVLPVSTNKADYSDYSASTLDKQDESFIPVLDIEEKTGNV